MIVVNKHTFDERNSRSIYIGRGSPYGNPFKIGTDGTREEVIEKYRQYLWKSISIEPDLWAQLIDVLGTYDYLVCYCAPKACHGDVLIAAYKYLQTTKEHTS